MIQKKIVTTSSRDEFVRLFGMLGNVLPGYLMENEQDPFTIFINGDGLNGKSAIADAITKAQFLDDSFDIEIFELEQKSNHGGNPAYLIGGQSYSSPQRAMFNGKEFTFLNVDNSRNHALSSFIEHNKTHGRRAGGVSFFVNTGEYEGRPCPHIEIINETIIPPRQNIIEPDPKKKPKISIPYLSSIFAPDQKEKNDTKYKSEWQYKERMTKEFLRKVTIALPEELLSNNAALAQFWDMLSQRKYELSHDAHLVSS